MKRTSTIILAGVLTLAGCRDMGLDYNLPLEEAMERPPLALVSAVMAPSDVADRHFIAEGRLWVPSGLPQTLAARDLQPVGASNGATVYARSWDTRPYGELFTALPAGTSEAAAMPSAEDGRFLGYAPVIGGGRPQAESGESGTPAAH
jgi:hypothetical protein